MGTGPVPPLGQSADAPAARGLWWRRRTLFAALPVLVLALAYVVATIDIRAHDGRVVRSVELAGIDVGGLSPDDLDAELDRLNSYVVTAPVYIETPDAAYQIDAERLGLQLDRPATIAAVIAAGRDGSAATRPFRWIRDLFSPHQIEAVLTLDPHAAEAGLAAVSKTISVEPGDPTLTMRNGRLELEPGTPGSILDVSRLLRDLSTSLPTEPGAPINVSAYTTADAMVDVEIQALVDELNGATFQPIRFVVDGTEVAMPSAEFRGLIELLLDGPSPRARLDAAGLHRWVDAAVGIAQGQIDTTTLIVEGSRVRLPAANAVRCCHPEVADRVLRAVLARQQPVELELIRDDVTPLVELGIAELMAEYTTEHPSGEDRVINIQRMADIVRGAIIAPGDEFSLNTFVGERTTDRGFVAAGVIYDGVFTEDVGGGVSQFATTLFNAAFFGGLDLVDYQAHSIYIDRYPYGREATVNWPSVDLVIANPTDYPILIWTEYTASSITVKLFGTAVVVGQQTDQLSQDLGECTRVRTQRTRTWVDGRTETDEVGALYQPEEGINCDGTPTVPPPECADGEVLVDTTDNGFGDACAPATDICPLPSQVVDDDGDGMVDYCETSECPTNTSPVDLDEDGNVDYCIEIAPPTPDPESPADGDDAGTAEESADDPDGEPTG